MGNNESGANNHATLEISIHPIFVAPLSIEDSVFDLVGDLGKMLFLFLRGRHLAGGDMQI